MARPRLICRIGLALFFPLQPLHLEVAPFLVKALSSNSIHIQTLPFDARDRKLELVQVRR